MRYFVQGLLLVDWIEFYVGLDEYVRHAVFLP
ncbi:hypothetical protein MPNT_330007 [Candidatus Methylacidithermus pantelleriae]|uniref:Uncharacterized protein n=1 Tax=Candidatus Methylacidithermus pantelleriae TaxID=2744239 RepID=A0A8J2FP39_9BACT|nr:hypothetical protein MPNT_330007 [Candidatus Methylacidithermus pantelleriae]